MKIIFHIENSHEGVLEVVQSQNKAYQCHQGVKLAKNNEKKVTKALSPFPNAGQDLPCLQ